MDKFVPAEDALEFAKFIPNHKLHIIEGANHEYTSHQGELTSVVLDFLRENFNAEKDMPKLPLKDHSFRSRL
jgi:pimeloyl-ACP methyl ester carboxylesterase